VSRRTLKTRAELVAAGWSRSTIRKYFRGDGWSKEPSGRWSRTRGFRTSMSDHDVYSWLAAADERADLQAHLVWPRNANRVTE
jgi:hypothetical protein